MGWNDLIGRQLGQYTILEEIGRGGSSRVYRGHDAGKQRDVAIKVIPNDAEDRVGFVRRFEREVQAVAQLNHPNIVTVFDRGETDDLVYLVMQCILGGTLRQRLGRPLQAPEAVGFVIQMAQALHHAHLRGIVHRDVKPSNMLLDAENAQHVLLTDFGIAKLQGARGLTKTGTTIGTPEYMAPEQAEGKETDPRADVYSLGCVLYEALSGRPPFVGSTPVSVLYQQVHSRPAYIRGFNPDVPRELTRILDLTLAKRPEDRFGTAESLAQALMPFVDQQQTSGSYRSASGSLLPPSMPNTPIPTMERGRVTGALPPSGGLPPSVSAPLGSLARPGEHDLPASQAWGGLGGAGLDDLFPDDPAPARAPQLSNGALVPPATPAWMSQAPQGVEHDFQPPNPTIPLPAFRLPAKPSRPLQSPDIAGSRHSADTYAARVNDAYGNSSETGLPGSQAYESPFPDATWHTMFAQSDGQNTGQHLIAQAGAASTGQSSVEDDEPITALRKALLHTGEHRVVRDVWRPTPEEAMAPTGSRGRKRRRRDSSRRPLIAGAALVAVLMLSVVTWVGISASGLGATLLQPPRAQTPKATPTQTTAPSPTATTAPAPTVTATTNPQQAIDNQAAASFRAVTLTTFVDGACSDGNAKTHFTSDQSIYINLCTAPSGTAAPMTVVFKQNGQVAFTLSSGQYISPGSGYWYSRYGVAPGTYDAVVTLTINGTQATARDIQFTVG